MIPFCLRVKVGFPKAIFRPPVEGPFAAAVLGIELAAEAYASAPAPSMLPKPQPALPSSSSFLEASSSFLSTIFF